MRPLKMLFVMLNVNKLFCATFCQATTNASATMHKAVSLLHRLPSRHHEQKMEEAVAAWGVAKGSAEKRFTGARDAAAGAWLAALQQAQASAAEQLLSAQQRWTEVLYHTAS